MGEWARVRVCEPELTAPHHRLTLAPDVSCARMASWGGLRVSSGTPEVRSIATLSRALTLMLIRSAQRSSWYASHSPEIRTWTFNAPRTQVRMQGDYGKPADKRLNYRHCFDGLFRVSRRQQQLGFCMCMRVDVSRVGRGRA